MMPRILSTVALLLGAAIVCLAGAPARTEPPKAAKETSAALVILAPGSEPAEMPATADTTVVVLPGNEVHDSVRRLPRNRSLTAPRPSTPAAPEAEPRLSIPEPPPMRASITALLRKGGWTMPANGKLDTTERLLPEDFRKDAALFLQRRLGVWREDDARRTFGTPVRDRIAFDADRKADGRILAFSDPSNRYREFELDFDRTTGYMRSIFIYPYKMKWDDCRKVWGTNVTTTEAANGRRFHSYENRRLDVLVDGGGNVISLGLY